MRKWLKAIVTASLISTIQASAVEIGDVLISADEAVKLIGKPDVMFVTGDSHDIFELGHIKGSVEMYAHHLHHADITGHMHCAPLFMCPDEAEKYIGSKGINNNTLVIAYDDFKGPNATGVYMYFKSFGHDNIKILNGGRAAVMAADPNQAKYDELKKAISTAKKENKPKEEIDKMSADLKSLESQLLVVKGKEEATSKEFKIDTSKIRYDLIAGKDEMVKAMQDILKNGKNSNFIILDSRGMTEVIGEKKLDNVARGGHIPGSTLIEWKNLTDFDKKLSYKELQEIKKVFEEQGVTKDKTIYAYCHVGAGRSTHLTTALQMLGYENVKVYTGSYDEWGNDMNLPLRR